jgi:uncharacterized Zn finger protein
MSCPTCDHTMQEVALDGPTALFWCERCGTIKSSHPRPQGRTMGVPKLVERCRSYAREFDKENIAQFYRNTWKRLGIAESIDRPSASKD